MEGVVRAWFSILLLVLFSCNTGSDEGLQEEYIKFITKAENGLVKTIKCKEFTFRVQLKTPQYLILTENKDSTHKTNTTQNERVKNLGKSVWFSVAIKPNEGKENALKYNVQDIENYNARLRYFLTEAEKNFALYQGNNQSNLIGYLFENSYGLKQEDVMNIGFSLKDNINKANILLTYKDDLFNNGILKFQFEKEDLNKLNNLTL